MATFSSEPSPVSAEAVRQAVAVLEALVTRPEQQAQIDPEVRERLLTACGHLVHPDRDTARKVRRAKRKAKAEAVRDSDRSALQRTGIRQKDLRPLFPTPAEVVVPDPSEGVQLLAPRKCYTCKALYTQLHPFYDSLCPPCGALNWQKRHQTADLTGRVALLTGGRVKIGYHAALKLLRAGATVVVTTRFPVDAARRFTAEEDAAAWQERLMVHGLDLRHLPSVETFAAEMNATLPRLDFILNNACQTVRRPPAFYAHMMADEERQRGVLSAGARRLLGAGALEMERSEQSTAVELLGELWGLRASAAASQVPLLADDAQPASSFPEGRYDSDGQQVDLRGVNSWRLRLAEVSTVEMLEVHLINSLAPAILNARLKPLMLRVPTRDKHIVNVSAMEGQFYRGLKTDKHPHTNMAKAALNMMTRTSAVDYVRDGIHMNSVDTGWITDEDPADIAARKVLEHDFHPPLDLVDAAARICDPIFAGLNGGEHMWGQFLKDYLPTKW